MILLVDSSSPLDVVDSERSSWRDWRASESFDVSLGVVVFGSSASWLPDPDAPLVGSSVLEQVRTAHNPNLTAALAAAEAGPRAPALLSVLSREPTPGWERSGVAARFPFRACVSTARDPVGAIGSGHLGANFHFEHLGLALRWLACELRDRSYWCVCGRLHVYGSETGPCECGDRLQVPARIRVRGKVVLLTEGARLYPHHLGRPLDFSKTVASASDLPREDGEITIDGVRAEVRASSEVTRTPGRAGKFRAPPVVADRTQCSACDGELVPPVHQHPPDPRRFCAKCVERGIGCDFCDVPVANPERTTWPDGRKACRACWNTSVTSAVELHHVSEQARRWLARRLGMTPANLPVHFEHAAQIARWYGRVFRPTRRFTPRTIGFFRRPIDGLTAAVYVEHGTPLSNLYGVLTHELVHVWQWENWPRDTALPLIEGLAMWAQYHALLDAGAIHDARQSELFGDPTYGLGFRVALAVEKEVGFDQVKDHLHRVTSVSVTGPA
jgi:hypothetical protein